MAEQDFLQWVIYAALTWLFLSVGSFLNVVIYRLPVMLQRDWLNWANDIIDEYAPRKNALKSQANDLPAGSNITPNSDSTGNNATSDHHHDNETPTPFNLAVPRSRCPNCEYMISAWQNIPLISWILLRGKCANCQVSISPRYPAIELLTCILSFVVVSTYGLSGLTLCYLILTWVLIAIAFIDYDTMLLPDNMTLPLLWGGLLVNLYFSSGAHGGTDTYSGLINGTTGSINSAITIETALIGAVAGYLMLWSVFWGFKLVTGKEGMGYGDFKLLAALGAWLGWQALPTIIMISAIAGLIVGGGLMLSKIIQRENPIPFGPFLAIAGWIVLIWGNSLTLLI
ncbi:MAG: A24 family peptidase [Pseudomonadales bacterium]|nr:A24 family peptidase [Pseudomonadales bacterium]